jgi:hypothetical protein
MGTDDESRKGGKISFTDGYGQNWPTVALRITRKDGTEEENVHTYVNAAQFMAQWFGEQDGAKGMDTSELFEEFKRNVCELMKAGVQGNG